MRVTVNMNVGKNESYCSYKPPVSRDTALHQQLNVIQPSESTLSSGIPYLLD